MSHQISKLSSELKSLSRMSTLSRNCENVSTPKVRSEGSTRRAGGQNQTDEIIRVEENPQKCTGQEIKSSQWGKMTIFRILKGGTDTQTYDRQECQNQTEKGENKSQERKERQKEKKESEEKERMNTHTHREVHVANRK